MAGSITNGLEGIKRPKKRGKAETEQQTGMVGRWNAVLLALLFDISGSFKHEAENLLRALARMLERAKLDKALRTALRVREIDMSGRVVGGEYQTPDEFNHTPIPAGYNSPHCALGREAMAGHIDAGAGVKIDVWWCDGIHTETFEEADKFVEQYHAHQQDHAVHVFVVKLGPGPFNDEFLDRLSLKHEPIVCSDYNFDPVFNAILAVAKIGTQSVVDLSRIKSLDLEKLPPVA